MSAARIIALALAMAIAGPAAADTPRPPAAAAQPFAPPYLEPPHAPRLPARRVKRWYGWQIITADMIGATLVIAGIGGETGGPVAAGALTYLIVTPTIHFAHDEGGQSAISAFLFRPIIALATIGLADEHCNGACNEESGKFTAIILSGWATATLIDAAMAYETVWVTPLVTPEGGRGLALTGTF